MQKQLSLANNIRQLIKTSGLKQFVVAERAGFTPKQFSDLLHNRKRIDAKDIPSIANALGVQPNKLFGIEDAMPHNLHKEAGK